jgi:hypothetical protein
VSIGGPDAANPVLASIPAAAHTATAITMTRGNLIAHEA